MDAGSAVLVVDDEEGVRELVRRILERRGFRVFTAKNGVEALLLSEHHAGPIRLLITDLVMPPYMDGSELAMRLRRRRPELRVLYMSGYPIDGMVQSEVRPAFLAKPFTADMLMRKVKELLHKPAFPARAPRWILVLIPEEARRSRVIDLLRGLGHRVLESRNIGEALGISQWHPDPIGLLLADPETLGGLPLELCERLCQAHPEMRILETAAAREGFPLAEEVRRALEDPEDGGRKS